ncbi:MAG: hypothetical protein COB15_04470 [Flavobacteriales bacterium]|nr:MAG: hypothetical protein COB15_04470 [Flavobacteriales bacterium]
MKTHLLEIKLTLCLVVIMTITSLNIDAQSLRLIMMPVSSGDACLVIFPNGKTMLIDSGTDGKYDDIVEPFLSRHCISHLDYWVLSHPHPDHEGGEAEMQSSGMIDANTVYWDYNTFNYADAFTAEGVDFFIYNVKDVSIHGNNGNKNSLAFRMEYNGWVYTTGGDEGVGSMQRFLADYPSLVPANVRKLAHHGYGPYDQAFLLATDAQLILVPNKIDIIAHGGWFAMMVEPIVNYLRNNGGRAYNPGIAVTGIDGFISIKVQNANDWNYTLDTYANRYSYMMSDWTQCISNNNYDASLTAVVSISDPACNSTTINPVIMVKNRAQYTLTSLEIEYDVDGGSSQTYNWSGNLPPGISEEVSLPTMTVSAAGNHTFNAECSLPNGQNDQQSNNDDISAQFSIASNTSAVDLSLAMDCYGEEITWTVVDSNGVTVGSGGPYPLSFVGEPIDVQLCLAPGCYDFNIFDTYGDGLDGTTDTTCGANGSYHINDDVGNTLVQMATPFFGNSATHNFCIGVITGIPSNTVDDFKIYPNPFKNSFTLQLSENTTYPITIEVLDYLGRKVHTQTITTSATEITLSNQLSPGTYFVKVTTQTTQKVVRMVKIK